MDDRDALGHGRMQRTAKRDELAGAGLRLDGADQQDEARRDFMFLRWLRTGVNGPATKIGWLGSQLLSAGSSGW